MEKPDVYFFYSFIFLIIAFNSHRNFMVTLIIFAITNITIFIIITIINVKAFIILVTPVYIVIKSNSYYI